MQIDTLQLPQSAYSSGVASTGPAAQERTNQKLRPKRQPRPVKETTTTTLAATAHESSATADDNSVNTATATEAAASEAVPAPPALAMPWRCVVWQRALHHENPYVQRLGLRSFLQRDWETPSRSPPLLHSPLANQSLPLAGELSANPLRAKGEDTLLSEGESGAGEISEAGRAGMGSVTDAFVRSVLLPAAVMPFQYHLLDGVSDGYDVQVGGGRD